MNVWHVDWSVNAPGWRPVWYKHTYNFFRWATVKLMWFVYRLVFVIAPTIFQSLWEKFQLKKWGFVWLPVFQPYFELHFFLILWAETCFQTPLENFWFELGAFSGYVKHLRRSGEHSAIWIRTVLLKHFIFTKVLPPN